MFGCAVYVHISDHWKLDKKAQKLRFISYTETACNYDSSRSELESTEETVVEVPAESEDDPVSEGEVDDQPALYLDALGK